MSAGLAERAVATRATGGRAVVSYERLSRFKEAVGFRDVDVTVGEDRQSDDADALAVDWELGPIDRHYRGDRSASEFRDREREAFQELLGDIAAGRVGVLIVWVMDRIVRDPEDQEKLFKLCRKHGVRLIQSGTRKELDLMDPDAMVHARIQGAMAAGEVAKMSMRIRRAKLANAERGLPSGGRRRFGYEPGFTAIRESEAAYIRELCSRFLAGESLYTLAKWLNSEGVTGASGGTWTGPNLRHLLKGPHLAGLRVHQGEVIGAAAWDPIIPVETHHHVVAMLSEPTRRTNGTGTNARRWLLSGIAVCDECGEAVRARPRTARGEVPSYRCPTGRHFHRPVELVDALVEAAVVKRLAAFDPALGVLVDDEASSELARLTAARAAMEEDLRDLADMMAAGELRPKAYATASGQLEDRMTATDAAIKVAAAEVGQSSRILAGAIGEAAHVAWFGDGTEDNPGWSLARKRAIVQELCAVRLRGGRRGRHSWDPDRDVVLNWR
jgi:DNA invertase Pin-like site-specific DNA recombinase